MFNKLLLAVALIAMSLAMSFAPTRAAELNGAGATLTYPLLTKWFSVYKPAKVVYQPTGNDSVFPRLKDKTIDFGGRDTPFSAGALRELPFPVVQMPIVATATAITYNLPNLKKPLRLSDEVLVDIFLGKITRWNDARLQVLNVGATLPNLPITLFRRPTQNASTQAVNVYLSAVSREWREKYGEMEVSKWPVGRGERSGSGTAWDLRDKPGGMAYMELAFATQQNLPMAEMRNRDGVFVAPSLDGVFHAIKHSIPALQRDLLAPIADARKVIR